MKRWLAGWMVLSVTGILLAGCNQGGDAISTVAVTGTVTYNGAPVEGANVIFSSTSESGHTASGRTDAQGKFTLTTYIRPDYQPEGAQEGEYAVAVSKMEAGGTMSPEDMMKKMAGSSADAPANLGPKNELPQMYADPKTSGFTASVSAGGAKDFTFELKD